MNLETAQALFAAALVVVFLYAFLTSDGVFTMMGELK